MNRLNWGLIVLGALCVLLEVVLGAATGFDLLLIGSAILLGGILGLLTHSPSIGVATAGVLAILYVLIGRKRVRAHFGRPGLPSNTDALLGKTVRVTEGISADKPGRVKYEGEEWRAHVDTPLERALEAGEDVRVHRIDGVTVFVERIARS